MFRGKLDRLHIGDLFEWLRLGGTSGWLTLAGGGLEARFLFRNGHIAFATSSCPAERLGAWLVRCGAVARDDLYPLLVRSLLSGRRLTDLLLEAGSADLATLRAQIVELTIRLLRRLLVAEGLRFRFQSSPAEAEMCSVTLDLELDPSSALLEAARRSDEGSQDAAEGGKRFPVWEDDVDVLVWGALERAYPDSVELTGASLRRSYALARDAVLTLGQWLQSSPGMVPIPTSELLDGPPEDGAALMGRPHLVWNLAVLAWALSETPRVEGTLEGLAEFAAADDLWLDLRAAERWLRPAKPRLDRTISELARELAAAAAGAAGSLGAEPDGAGLAAHLYVVPAAMTLYVLTAVPIPAEALRRQLIATLPPKLGGRLALRAGLPEELIRLLAGDGMDPVTTSLRVARRVVANGGLLPEPGEHGPETDPVDAEKAARAALVSGPAR